MDALSIINTRTQAVESVAPAKAKNTNEQQFDGVLNKKQQAESTPVKKQSKTAENSKDRQAVVHTPKTEKNAGQNEVASKSTTQPEAETTPQKIAKVQQTLIDLLQAMTQTQNKSDGADKANNIETLLTDLGQQLNSTEFHGEEVLAGVDLTALTEKIRSLQDDPDQEELLAQLIVQVENQLADQPEIQGNADLSAAPLAESTQQSTTSIRVENLAQARQILQNAIDAVAPQKTEKTMATENVVIEESVAVVEQPAEEKIFAGKEADEAIDPRFAGLLKQRGEQHPGQKIPSGKEQTSQHHSKQPVELKQDEATVQVPVVETSQKGETTQLPNSGSKQVFENLVQHPQHNLQGQGQPQVQGLATDKAIPQPPVMQLASGQQVPESQICDQVVTHLSGSVNGESGRMVLRLQPAELGSLRLELKVEGDRIQANLHAQNHQVQEVLERNLPQLRHALAEQGLKIDQFQVNVDQRQQSGQFENLAQQQQQNNGSEKQPEWQQQTLEPEEQNIPLAHLLQNGGGGINLHA